MAVPSEIAAAKVKFSSESTAAELLIDYQKRVFSKSDFSDMRWNRETDEGFENAIFEKGSPYLRLLLLQSVTSHDVAVKLWNWADQSIELTPEQGLAVKKTLIEGSAAQALLFEGGYEPRPMG